MVYIFVFCNSSFLLVRNGVSHLDIALQQAKHNKSGVGKSVEAF